jgi:DNA-binding transcriptional LysR family regulator
VHHIFATRVLGKYIKQIDKDVKIFINDYPRDEAIKKVQSKELDFIIYPFYDSVPSLTNRIIAKYKPLLVMNKNNPLASKSLINPEDIATQNLIKIKKELIILPLFNQFAEQYKWQSQIQFNTPDWALLTHLARNDLGVAVVSEICIEGDSDLIFKDLSHIFPVIEYSIITNPSLIYENHVIDCIKLFSSSLAEELLQ